MNNKGFVLTETLVVTVFLVTIFTFIYVSIVPLLGKYEDEVMHNSDIDIVYKLYHIRNMINKDLNKDTIKASNFKDITCNDLANKDYCNKLMDFLELRYYRLIYTKSIKDNLSSFNSYMYPHIYDYIKNYRDVAGGVLVLSDENKLTIAYLLF